MAEASWNTTIIGDWSILDVTDGESSEIITFDTFVSADVQKTSRITEYPAEGSFYSYNKVRQSYTANIVLAYSEYGVEVFSEKSESIYSKLETLALYVNKPRLLSIITPYMVFNPVSLEGMSYDIKRENGGIITVQLRVKEIRQVTPISTTTFKDSNAVSIRTIGSRQAKSTTESEGN